MRLQINGSNAKQATFNTNNVLYSPYIQTFTFVFSCTGRYVFLIFIDLHPGPVQAQRGRWISPEGWQLTTWTDTYDSSYPYAEEWLKYLKWAQFLSYLQLCNVHVSKVYP